jgi:hypothetical protein
LLTNKVAKPTRDGFSLFDHIVGAAKVWQRYAQAERLGCLEIDDEFDFRRLLNGKLAGFSPLRMRPI